MNTYKIAPMYRRSAWYLAGGSLLSLPVIGYLRFLDEPAGLESVSWSVCLALLVPAFLLVI